MKYAEYIKSLGFMTGQIDDIKEYVQENGGTMSAINDGSDIEIRLFFTNGINRKITIKKNKNKFHCEMKTGDKTFDSFESMMKYIGDET